MRFDSPHPIPYQGSKRKLAPAILSFIPKGKFAKLIEPFAGSAAVTLAAAKAGVCETYVLADILCPLTEIWKDILESPDKLNEGYRKLWLSQGPNPTTYFNEIRLQFNRRHEPAQLLFLLARCVKNAVRFSNSGQFNQSPDKRRTGVHPDKMAAEIFAAHELLKGRCDVVCGDFESVLESASCKDIIYMDPPYQGTSEGSDSRYVKSVSRQRVIKLLDDLNGRGIAYLLSYDGSCGSKMYGEPLPEFLKVKRVLLDAGVSSQETLSGRNSKTIESLYLSPELAGTFDASKLVVPRQFSRQAQLFQ